LEIVCVEDAGQLDALRALLREYAASLDFDLSFQDFERELADLPGEYAPPTGGLFLALVDDRPVGCVALRRLDRETCEMKRLYVRPTARGLRVGRGLAEAVIDEARRLGYARVRLDTVPGMDRALALYRALGFYEIGAYRFNPIAGAKYMERHL
jgi:ribosomal protein S18 acetylase RimI-like enzyme